MKPGIEAVESLCQAFLDMESKEGKQAAIVLNMLCMGLCNPIALERLVQSSIAVAEEFAQQLRIMSN